MADQKQINAESLNHAAGTTCSLLHLIFRRLALGDGRLMTEFEMTCIETANPAHGRSFQDGYQNPRNSQFAHSNGFAESPNSEGNLDVVGFLSPFADLVLDSLP